MIKKSFRAYITRRKFILLILADSEMIRVFFLRFVKQKVNGVREILVIFPCLACVNHINQHCEILFFLRGLIPDVGDKRRIIQLLGLW